MNFICPKVVFNENSSPYKTTQSTLTSNSPSISRPVLPTGSFSSPSSLPLSISISYIPLPQSLHRPSDNSDLPTMTCDMTDVGLENIVSSPGSSNPIGVADAPQWTHHMVTHSGDGSLPLRRFTISRHPVAFHVSSALQELTSLSNTRKYSHCRHAMMEKFQALLHNHTWDLVPPNPSQNVIGCKWVYEVK